MSYTDSVKDTLLILNAAQHVGLDCQTLLKKVDIDPVLLSDPESRIESKKNTQLLHAAIDLSGDPLFAVQSGNAIKKFPESLYYMLVTSSKTLFDAASIAARYYNLQSEASSLMITEQEDKVFVNFSRTSFNNADPRCYVEFVFSTWMRSIKDNISPNAIPEKINFAGSKPDDVSTYERYFKCPVYFGQQDNQLVWNKRIMSLPNINFNLNLRVILQRYATIQVSKLGKKDDFIEKVKEVITNKLYSSKFSLQSVSDELNIAPRTLQNRLQKVNKSFNILVDEVRKNIALNYLNDTSTSIRELALVLGFSQVKSFYRAFHRWTGLTPAEYRRKNLNRKPC